MDYYISNLHFRLAVMNYGVEMACLSYNDVVFSLRRLPLSKVSLYCGAVNHPQKIKLFFYSGHCHKVPNNYILVQMHASWSSLSSYV